MSRRDRAIVWTVLIGLGLFRPGVDLIDRWLVSSCWHTPSQWNAVADAAIRTGVVDGTIAGTPAPWRQASVHTVGSSRVAVVTVSDLRRARVAFLSDRYEVLGRFERVAADASLVTDETRGFKPLSHYWPIVRRDNRLHTLIAFASQSSQEPNTGVFAYIAIGRDANELLFVTRLGGPGPLWGALTHLDLDHDGIEDIAFYPKGQKDRPPLAAFVWDASRRTYVASVTADGRPLIAWWSTRPSDRVTIPSGAPIDDAILQVAARLQPTS
jgi:hypothetical protein